MESSAQTPGSSIVADARLRMRRERRIRFFVGLRLALKLVVPVVFFATCADLFSDFTHFSSRSVESEARGNLKLLSLDAAPPTWTGRTHEAAWIKGGKIHYDYVRTPADQARVIFAAVARDDARRMIGTDLWAAVAGNAPVHCFDGVYRGRLLSLSEQDHSADPACLWARAAFGLRNADLIQAGDVP